MRGAVPGLMVSALVPGASGPGSSTGLARDTVGTLAWPGSLWGVPANCWENLTNGSRMTCDGLASIPSRGSRNTPSHFMLQKLGISSRSYDPVGSKAWVFWILFFSNLFSFPWSGPWCDPWSDPVGSSFLNVSISRQCARRKKWWSNVSGMLWFSFHLRN